MIALSLQGIRGGVGTSSTLAALSYALSTLGQRVLVVDMCPENTLGLHFNLDYALPGGWAPATLNNSPWYQDAWNIEPGLDVLPYGTLAVEQHLQLDTLLRDHPQLWAQRQTSLADSYDWVLFDLAGACEQPAVRHCPHGVEPRRGEPCTAATDAQQRGALVDQSL